ncbi:DNA primase [Streptomyces sp. XM83C]|uniref:bifunctional DNA primase/polymerase n=1 Tax=Streptomyces sp. XM83C TaxID=2929781 RepID=UPI001FF8F287|nr:bifunctional DNA primase/polymerase [Streptomyces sp. XM83C]MCK1819476.1 DNA primase [Streptomyces sp. XM83C]
MAPARKTASPPAPARPQRPPLSTALNLAVQGVPPLPLRAGKMPFGNCPRCTGGACGGRPNMKNPGPCQCPAPCHAWAAATTDTRVLTSPAWAPAWREAVAVGYHPGGAGVTVVDLDTPAAVAWARETLPATRTVPTTRGEHWIYRGVMRSANAVRPGVDIKSAMAYARWLGAGSQAFGVARFLAIQHTDCPGPCGLDALGEEIVAAAVSVGVPEAYARRAVANGLDTGQGAAA